MIRTGRLSVKHTIDRSVKEAARPARGAYSAAPTANNVGGGGPGRKSVSASNHAASPSGATAADACDLLDSAPAVGYLLERVDPGERFTRVPSALRSPQACRKAGVGNGNVARP